MPSHAYYYTRESAPPRRKHTKKSRDTGRIYAKDESERILEASREALRQAHRRPRRTSTRNAGYYHLPRVPTPEIPPYEAFLAEARARVNHGRAGRVEPARTVRRESFYPDPYLYGYPSGYYADLRVPQYYRASGATDGTWRASTLVDSDSHRSSTLVNSDTSSYGYYGNVRTVEPHRQPRHQARVHFGQTYHIVEPSIVSDSSHKNASNLLPQVSSRAHALHAVKSVNRAQLSRSAYNPSAARSVPSIDVSLSRTQLARSSAHITSLSPGRNRADLAPENAHLARGMSRTGHRSPHPQGNPAGPFAVSRWSPDTVMGGSKLQHSWKHMKLLAGRLGGRT